MAKIIFSGRQSIDTEDVCLGKMKGVFYDKPYFSSIMFPLFPVSRLPHFSFAHIRLHFKSTTSGATGIYTSNGQHDL